MREFNIMGNFVARPPPTKHVWSDARRIILEHYFYPIDAYTNERRRGFPAPDALQHYSP